MKNFFFLLFAIAIITACQPENSSEKEKVTLADTLASTSTAASLDTAIGEISNRTSWDSLEVFDLDLILLNGTLPTHTTMKKLIQVLGTADSTNESTDECAYHFEAEEAYYYYKDASRFEVLQDSAILGEFRFTHGHFLLYQNRKLTHQTTLAEMKKWFPYAGKQVERDREANLEMMPLRESENSDNHIRFFFKAGKLHSIYYFIPC